MRIFLGGDYTAAKKELFEYAQRCISFDFAGTRAYFTNQNNNYSTKLYSENGWYQVAYASCPQPTGFNVVKLEDKDYLLLDEADVEFIVEDYE
jgi:hypothetical protein